MPGILRSEPVLCHFYSRPCGRGDPNRHSATNSSLLISTHAPAGGATASSDPRFQK